MKRFIPVIIIFLALFSSCGNRHLDLPDYEEELVVEGWIENGHSPVVLVSTTLPISSEPRPVSGLEEHMVRYATVSVSVDDEEYFLTARLNESLTLKNYYSSPELTGVVGKTYTLKVVYDNMEASAECAIPEPPAILSSQTSATGDGYVTSVSFRNDGGYYKSFVLEPGAGLYSDEGGALVSGAEEKVEIVSQCTHTAPSATVKLASMEKPIYDFWKSFQNIVSVKTNKNFNSYRNVRGNVQGALGYWAGYGVSLTSAKKEGEK